MKTKNELSGKVLYCLSVLLYVINDSLLKFLSIKLSLGTLVFFRALFGIVILILISIAFKVNLYHLKSYRSIFERCLYSFITVSLSIKALKGLNFQLYNIYYHLAPVFTVILAVWLLKEKLNRKIFISIVFCFLGSFITFNSKLGGELKYHIYAILASFFWALSITKLKKVSSESKPIKILFYATLFNLIITFPFIHDIWIEPELYYYIILLAITHITAFYLVIVSLQRLSLSKAAPLEYTGIIWSLIIGYITWEENLEIQNIVGFTLIIVSSYCCMKLNKK